jgi:hypothetical protein
MYSLVYYREGRFIHGLVLAGGKIADLRAGNGGTGTRVVSRLEREG